MIVSCLWTNICVQAVNDAKPRVSEVILDGRDGILNAALRQRHIRQTPRFNMTELKMQAQSRAENDILRPTRNCRAADILRFRRRIQVIRFYPASDIAP